MSKLNDFRLNIIKPVLEQMGSANIAAEELLLGTAIQESLILKYRVQMSGAVNLANILKNGSIIWRKVSFEY